MPIISPYRTQAASFQADPNLIPSAASAGISAGHAMPSKLSAIATGIQEGIDKGMKTSSDINQIQIQEEVLAGMRTKNEKEVLELDRLILKKTYDDQTAANDAQTGAITSGVRLDNAKVLSEFNTALQTAQQAGDANGIAEVITNPRFATVAPTQLQTLAGIASTSIESMTPENQARVLGALQTYGAQARGQQAASNFDNLVKGMQSGTNETLRSLNKQAVIAGIENPTDWVGGSLVDSTDRSGNRTLSYRTKKADANGNPISVSVPYDSEEAQALTQIYSSQKNRPSYGNLVGTLRSRVGGGTTPGVEVETPKAFGSNVDLSSSQGPGIPSTEVFKGPSTTPIESTSGFTERDITPKPIRGPNPVEAKSTLSKVNVDNLVESPEAQVAFSQSLGLEPNQLAEGGVSYRDFAEQVQLDAQNRMIQKELGVSESSSPETENYFNQTKIQLTNTLAREGFKKAMTDPLKARVYTPGAVEIYNKQVDKNLTDASVNSSFLSALVSPTGMPIANTELGLKGFGYQKVTSPEELYSLKFRGQNEQLAQNTINSFRQKARNDYEQPGRIANIQSEFGGTLQQKATKPPPNSVQAEQKKNLP